MNEDAFCGRKMILWKFHNKWSRIACKHLCFLQDNTGDNNHKNSHEIHGRSHPRDIREHCSANQGDDREFCTTGNKGGGHNGHTTVFFIFNGFGSHNTRDATTGADEHWDKALTGQAEFTENTVHDKGNTCHITTVLQNGEEEKQDQHLGHKSQDSANAANNTVNYQAN